LGALEDILVFVDSHAVCTVKEDHVIAAAYLYYLNAKVEGIGAYPRVEGVDDRFVSAGVRRMVDSMV